MLIGESNGVYYIEPGTYNTMTVGAPRSGKGECYVLPSLRLMANAKEKPSVIVNDMKGELLELTYKEFARNGYKIVTLNLIDTDRSDCWNPLQLIIDEYLTAKHGNNDLSQTSKLVSSFAHCLTDDTQSEAIWTDSARSLLSALIYYFLDKGYEKMICPALICSVSQHSLLNLEFTILLSRTKAATRKKSTHLMSFSTHCLWAVLQEHPTLRQSFLKAKHVHRYILYFRVTLRYL